MIRLLAISGSPVEGSSTDLLLQRMIGAITDKVSPAREIGHAFVKLNQLKAIPCQACGEAPATSWCFFDDELLPVLNQLAECDCLLFGSPVYFDSVSAQAKQLIDRSNCFRPPDFDNTDPDHYFLKRLKHKRPGAIILVGGENTWYEGARRTIAGFFKWVEVTNEGVVRHASPDYNRKGTVVEDTDTLRLADSVAVHIAGLLLEKAENSR